MTTFELSLFEGHPIITENGNRILIDTGSPITICNTTQCNFLNKNYPATSNYGGLTIPGFSHLVGTPFDILMGTDVLRNYRILFDYKNSTISIGGEELELVGKTIALSSAMGIPILEVVIEDRTLRCFLDSGAKLSYLSSGITSYYKRTGIENDFYPGIGVFSTPCFDINSILGQDNFMVKYGNLPDQLVPVLAQAGTQGLLGFDFFNNFKLLLDIKNTRLTYVKSN